MSILVTGAAGFIGANLTASLLRNGESVVGIDSMNDYYSVELKRYRLKTLDETAAASRAPWAFLQGNIADKAFIQRVFAEYAPSIVVNLAAQAGIRYSLVNPDAYIESNIIGFYNILEACRHSYDGGAKAWSTWCTPPAHPFMDAAKSFHIPRKTRWTTPSAFTRQQKNPTSSWPMPMPSSTTSP